MLERQREASRDRSQQRKISSSENAQVGTTCLHFTPRTPKIIQFFCYKYPCNQTHTVWPKICEGKFLKYFSCLENYLLEIFNFSWAPLETAKILSRKFVFNGKITQPRIFLALKNFIVNIFWQRPGTAETAAQCNPEDGVQRHEGKKISPAKLQRRLSVSWLL